MNLYNNALKRTLVSAAILAALSGCGGGSSSSDDQASLDAATDQTDDQTADQTTEPTTRELYYTVKWDQDTAIDPDYDLLYVIKAVSNDNEEAPEVREAEYYVPSGMMDVYVVFDQGVDGEYDGYQEASLTESGAVESMRYYDPATTKDYMETLTYNADGTLASYSESLNGVVGDTDSYTYSTATNAQNQTVNTIETDRDDDGTVDRISTETFDANGNLVESTYDYNLTTPEANQRSVYTYDAQNRETLRTFDQNDDGTIDFTITTTYDANGASTRTSYRGTDTDPVTNPPESVTVMDADGLILSFSQDNDYPTDGTFDRISTYEYNAAGLMTKEIYDNDGDVDDFSTTAANLSVTINEYNADNLMTLTKRQTISGIDETTVISDVSRAEIEYFETAPTCNEIYSGTSANTTPANCTPTIDEVIPTVGVASL